jgi:hypothetical protein
MKKRFDGKKTMIEIQAEVRSEANHATFDRSKANRSAAHSGQPAIATVNRSHHKTNRPKRN